MTNVEQYIQDYKRTCSNQLISVQDRFGEKVISYYEWLTPDHARRVAEIAREETIEKAVEWLKNNLYNYAGEDDKRNIVPFDNIVFEDFRRAMKGGEP